MGCTLLVVHRSPKKGGVGQWVEGEKQPTLVEKWIEFREWVRRKRGKKTKVVPINIEPCEWNLVNSLSNTSVGEGDGVSVWSVCSYQCSTEDQQEDDQPRRNEAGGIATKKIGPKAAKGARTVVQLVDTFRIPGAVISDEDLDTGKAEPERGYLDRGRCPVILQLGEETCVPVEGEEKESPQRDKIKSGGLWRRLRPKPAKGKRSTSSVQGQEKILKHAAGLTAGLSGLLDEEEAGPGGRAVRRITEKGKEGREEKGQTRKIVWGGKGGMGFGERGLLDE